MMIKSVVVSILYSSEAAQITAPSANPDTGEAQRSDQLTRFTKN